MAKRDYYEILGLSREAKEADIKSAYRKAARKYHPDVNKASDAAERFAEATEAYEVLSDPEKRKLYDQYGHAGVTGQGPGGPRGGRTQWGPPPGEGFGVDFEDLFGGGGARGGEGFVGMSLDDILNALRGGAPGAGARAGRSARRPAPAPAADLEHHLTLDFLQAVQGTTTVLQLQVPDESGAPRTETIHVKIPPGVKEGSKIRVPGKGGLGRRGRGDLYITCHVNPHPYFRREGNDLSVTVPISLSEAALGAKVDVPTIDGVMTVTIPPGMSGGRKLRLRGKGVASVKGSARGDQYVEIRIAVPPTLSDRGRELLEELRRTDPYDPRKDVPWRMT